MESKVSEKYQQRTLADVFAAVPTLTDTLDCRSLRALCQASRFFRQTVDHASTWQTLLARNLGINRSYLPTPPQDALRAALAVRGVSRPPPAFKMMCQGLAALQHKVDNPHKSPTYDLYLTMLSHTAQAYLAHHVPSMIENHSARTSEVTRHHQAVSAARLGAQEGALFAIITISLVAHFLVCSIPLPATWHPLADPVFIRRMEARLRTLHFGLTFVSVIGLTVMTRTIWNKSAVKRLENAMHSIRMAVYRNQKHDVVDRATWEASSETLKASSFPLSQPQRYIVLG